MYKRSAKLTELEDIRDQLTSCCYEELYYDLLRSLGSTLLTMSEDSLAKEMKRLAVPHHSNPVNIVALKSITQKGRIESATLWPEYDSAQFILKELCYRNDRPINGKIICNGEW